MNYVKGTRKKDRMNDRGKGEEDSRTTSNEARYSSPSGQSRSGGHLTFVGEFDSGLDGASLLQLSAPLSAYHHEINLLSPSDQEE